MHLEKVQLMGMLYSNSNDNYDLYKLFQIYLRRKANHFFLEERVYPEQQVLRRTYRYREGERHAEMLIRLSS